MDSQGKHALSGCVYQGLLCSTSTVHSLCRLARVQQAQAQRERSVGGTHRSATHAFCCSCKGIICSLRAHADWVFKTLQAVPKTRDMPFILQTSEQRLDNACKGRLAGGCAAKGDSNAFQPGNGTAGHDLEVFLAAFAKGVTARYEENHL
jgi:hypothetical protein